MNTQLVEWAPPPARNTGLAPLLPVAAEEARRRPVVWAAVFATIALGVLAIGLTTPKRYTSSTTILVEESNIIEPLMKGRAVPTTVTDRASIAREVAFSRKGMKEILATGGWLEGNPSPLEQERLIDQIAGRTTIANPRENTNLIQISYSDTDPDRAHRVTEQFADLIIQESLLTKQRESRQAYEFIDSQVGHYHRELTESEKRLAEYRRANPDARPGTEEEVSRRIGELRTEVDRSRLDLTDLSSQAGMMQSHLARESTYGASGARSSQIRSRLAELQSEQAQLASKYTDQHPDMIRVRQQIRDLQAQARSGGGASAAPAGAAAFDPALSDVRNRVAEARSRSAASASRVALGRELLEQELQRSQRIIAASGQLAELTRDYEVNRDLYQDLLERRENARLSMNLDAQKGGLNFRIQEPASVPLQATGMRLMQVAGLGLLAAVVVPVLLLLAWVRLDPRVRTPSQIEQVAGLPVLGSIPVRPTGRAHAQSSRRRALATALVLAVPLAYALAMALR